MEIDAQSAEEAREVYRRIMEQTLALQEILGNIPSFIAVENRDYISKIESHLDEAYSLAEDEIRWIDDHEVEDPEEEDDDLDEEDEEDEE